MEAKIVTKTDDFLVIQWDDPKIGFGQLTMRYDKNIDRYIMDAEMMGVDHVIAVFQALKLKD